MSANRLPAGEARTCLSEPPGCAYGHTMNVFAWTVIGSVAGVVGAAAAIVFGLVPFLQGRKQRAALPGDTGRVSLMATRTQVLAGSGASRTCRWY